MTDEELEVLNALMHGTGSIAETAKLLGIGATVTIDRLIWGSAREATVVHVQRRIRSLAVENPSLFAWQGEDALRVRDKLYGGQELA